MSGDRENPELPHYSSTTVAIVDDEFTSRVILDKIVRSTQPNILTNTFSDPITALEWIQWNHPDLILVDYRMKEMTGLDLIKKIRLIRGFETIPIIVITAHDEPNVRYSALEAGATDFLTKPIDPYECRVRCRNLLALRQHEKTILEHSQMLEHAVRKATQKIREREQETLYCLAKAGEFRDSETGNHVLRMAKYSKIIAEGLGLGEERCSVIELAAPMHDIGKIGVPDYILLKPGKLTPEEFMIMRTHTTIGHKILKESPSMILSQGANIALSHHEKYDGTGYPQSLKGKDIPLEARIVAVADVFDALTSTRPYKRAWTNDQAIEYIVNNKAKHFDPACVESFMQQMNKVSLVQQQLQDNPITSSAHFSQ